MYLVNPTAGGRIQPHLENWDGVSVRITRTAVPCGHAGNPHEHPDAQGQALDMGDGKCTRPVVAAAAGVVGPRTAAMVMQGIVHINHAEGVRTDYSHMHPVLVSPGQVVKQGQQIGEIGDARDVSVFPTMACHLHYNVLINGVQVDPMPYINMTPPATGEDMIQGANPVRLVNKQTSVTGNATNFRPDPTTSKPALAQFPAGTIFLPDFSVTGQAVGGSTNWLAGFLPVNGKQTLGYFHESVCGPLTPAQAISSGFTQADLDNAKAAGVATGTAAKDAEWEAWWAKQQGVPHP
jgi:hypothetical protein